MVIPIINPNRPPREWFKEKVAKIKSTSRKKSISPESIVGHIWYHKLTPKKRSEIISRYENPKRRSCEDTGLLSQTKRSGTMPRTRRRTFKSLVGSPVRRRRMNPKRKTAKVKRVASTAGMHRPRVYNRAGKWYRSKKSKLFRSPTMLNPRRRRRKVRHTARRRRNPIGYMSNPRRRRRHSATRRNLAFNPRRRRSHRRVRRNPRFTLKSLMAKGPIMTAVKAGAGIAIGFLAVPILNKLLPSMIKPPRRYFGVLPLAAGILTAGLVKNKNAKEVGLYIAATGIYDLIAMNIPQLGLPTISTSAAWLDKVMPGAPASLPQPTGSSYPVPYAPVSPVARMAMGGSYSSSTKAGYAGSYQAPDMRTEGFGTDNPFDDIEGYQG